MPGISDPAISADVLEEAAKEVEKLLTADYQYAELSGKLKVTSNSKQSISWTPTCVYCIARIFILMIYNAGLCIL